MSLNLTQEKQCYLIRNIDAINDKYKKDEGSKFKNFISLRSGDPATILNKLLAVEEKYVSPFLNAADLMVGSKYSSEGEEPR